MTVHAIESLLWRLVSDPGSVAAFNQDPDAFMAPSRMSDAEKAAVRAWDIQGLGALGVNNMILMMGFQAIHGRAELPEYLRRMNGGRVDG